jgi:hypothetical protein
MKIPEKLDNSDKNGEAGGFSLTMGNCPLIL